MEYHNPVLLQASVDGLNIKHLCRCNFWWWRTFKRNLQKTRANGKLFAFDQDEDALANALLMKDLHLSKFPFYKGFAFYGVKSVDGILADLDFISI
jgi:16S rRNA (cytosine1402-N4)-methyltransferase